MNLLTLAASAHGLCWAIEPQRGQALLADYSPENREENRPEPAAFSTFGRSTSEDERPYRMVDGVALIPLVGAMTKGRSYYYCGTSTAIVRAMIGMAAADEKVKSILLYCDSPGGSVDGVQELADTIAAVSKKKPVTTFYEDCGASAAYWGTCTSSKLVMNAAGMVGSLGIMMMLCDASQAAEAQGLNFILLSTGPLKGRGSGPLPIDDDTKAMYQRVVDGHGDRFSGTIASARKLTAERMKDVFTGDVFNAAAAQRLGLVDGVSTLEDVVSDLVAGISDGDDDIEATGAALTVPEGLAGGASTIVLTAERKAALSAGVSREQFTAIAGLPAPQPISAPGGSPGSAGTRQAPNAGAEKPGTPRMSFRQNLLNNLAARGFGKMVVALNGTTSEDPEVIARIVTEQVEAQAAELVANHSLIVVAKAHGVTDLESFNAFHARAKDGDRYLTDMRAEAKLDAIRAFGPESGAIVGASVNDQSLAQVIASRDAWRKMADDKHGISPTGEGPGRRSAPSPVAPADADAAAAAAGKDKSAWARLTDEQRTRATQIGIVGEKKQETYAKNLLGEAA